MPRKGTESGVPLAEVAPGAEVFGDRVGLANRGRGTREIVNPPVPVPKFRESREYRMVDCDFINDAGVVVQPKDLNLITTVFGTTGVSFPGAATPDDNSAYYLIPVPDDMHETDPQVEIELFTMGESA